MPLVCISNDWAHEQALIFLQNGPSLHASQRFSNRRSEVKPERSRRANSIHGARWLTQLLLGSKEGMLQHAPRLSAQTRSNHDNPVLDSAMLLLQELVKVVQDVKIAPFHHGRNKCPRHMLKGRQSCPKSVG